MQDYISCPLTEHRRRCRGIHLDVHLVLRADLVSSSPLVQLELHLLKLSTQLVDLFLLLLISALPLLGRKLLIHGHRVLDGLGSPAKVQRRFGLGLIVRGRGAADDDGGAGIASQRLLQDARQLRVSVRNVRLVAVGECRDHVAKG